MRSKKGTLYAGTSGLQLPVPKSKYPQGYRDKSRLCYYSSLYNSVEVNSSFYRLPQVKTIDRWLLESGDDFRFTFKLWRNITHVKALDYSKAELEQFFKVIGRAEAKKGCLLIQLPPGLQASHQHRLSALLQDIRSYNDWDIAIEFRHVSWYDAISTEALKPFNATIVLHDMPASATPEVGIATDFAYLRFHGPGGKYRGSYDEPFLTEQARHVKEWLQEGKDVYAYFNNTMGDALGNLHTFKQIVEQD